MASQRPSVRAAYLCMHSTGSRGERGAGILQSPLGVRLFSGYQEEQKAQFFLLFFFSATQLSTWESGLLMK